MKPNAENCKNCSSKCAYDCAQLQYTIQNRTVLIISPLTSRHKLKNCSHLCAHHCAQLSYTTRHRTVLIIFTSRQTSRLWCCPLEGRDQVLCGRQEKWEQLLPKVIWEEHVATPHGRECTRLLCALAVQCRLQTSPITQPWVHYIHTHSSHTLSLADFPLPKTNMPIPVGDSHPTIKKVIHQPTWPTIPNNIYTLNYCNFAIIYVG